MFESQTLSEYMENPMGKGSTAIYNRKLIIDDLNNRYSKLLEGDDKEFEYSIYQHKDDIYFHFKIPSESKRDNNYDVVIQFYIESDKSIVRDTTLKRYSLRFFSNCPSFTYTYANVYDSFDLLIPFLRDKYPDEIFDKEPVVKNPGSIINFEKSLYFACKYISDHKITLMNKIFVGSRARRLNVEKFREDIRESDDILLEIQKENNRLRNKAEAEKRRKKRSQEYTKPKTSPDAKPDNKVKSAKPSYTTNKITAKPKLGKRTHKNKIRAKKKI